MWGLTWAAGVWLLTLALLAPSGVRRLFGGSKLSLTNAEIAIVLSLLGTHTFAAETSAEDVLANPLIIERVVRGGLSALALLLVLTQLHRRIGRVRELRAPALGALTLYVAVAGASIAYSVAPIVTAGKVFEIAVAMTIVWTIMLGPEPGKALARAVRLVVILEAALVVAALVGFFALPDIFASLENLPGFVARRVMVSPFAASNSLSASGALVSAFSLASLFTAHNRRARAGWAAFFLAGTFGMLLAAGRQGLIIWLVAVAMVVWIHRRRLFVLLIGPAVAVVVWVNWAQLLALFTRNQAPENLATWSGRLNYWQAAISAWQSHPWTGYGFGAGGRFVALASIGADQVSSLHSGYFEALVGLGVVGIVPLLLTVVLAGRWAVRHLIARSSTPIAILIIPLLIHTSVALGFGGWLQEGFYLLALLAALSDVGHTQQPLGPPEPTHSAYLSVDPFRGA